MEMKSNDNSDSRVINTNLPKIIEFIDENCNENDIYNNIFLLLKLKYLMFYKQFNENVIHIPENIMNIFSNYSEKLTFLDISGYNESICQIDNFIKNMIFIPENLIVRFFKSKKTNCIDEDLHIKNKLDLYFSILTYIYYHSFPKLNKNINFNLTNFMKNVLEMEENEKIVTLLYKSIIYNFINIPNDMEYFHYNYVNIDGLNFYNFYNINNNSSSSNDSSSSSSSSYNSF